MAERNFEADFWKTVASEFPDHVGDWLKDRQPPPTPKTVSEQLDGLEDPFEETMRRRRIMDVSRDERIIDYFLEAEGSYDTEEALGAVLQRDHGLKDEYEIEEAIHTALGTLQDVVGFPEVDDREDYGYEA